MLGINVSEGTAEGWFGQGKTSAILSVIVLLALIVGVPLGIFAAVNAGGDTSVSQPPAPATPTAPTVPTPTEPTPSVVTEEPAPAGVIKITTEKLISELLANPNKYKKGTVFHVSGVFTWERKMGLWPYESELFFLGPPVYVDDQPLGVWITVREKEKEAFKTFNALDEDDGEVIVQGTYYFLGRQGVQLDNVSLVSTPKTR